MALDHARMAVLEMFKPLLDLTGSLQAIRLKSSLVRKVRFWIAMRTFPHAAS